jgi:hypothetical protein
MKPPSAGGLAGGGDLPKGGFRSIESGVIDSKRASTRRWEIAQAWETDSTSPLRSCAGCASTPPAILPLSCGYPWESSSPKGGLEERVVLVSSSEEAVRIPPYLQSVPAASRRDQQR